MKASEMTNEELANNLDEFANAFHNDSDKSIMRDAAARLRKVDAIRAKLKAADYALGESRVAVCSICDQKHMCGHGTAKFDPCCIYKDIDNALAAIREEGAVK